MLKGNTLFILGAGASKPYGLPTGAELNLYISQVCSDRDALHMPLCQAIRRPLSDLEKFATEFRNSGLPSIDSFLARRDEYLEVGRAAIATILCQFEKPSDIDHVNPSHDWYRLIWGHLQESLETPIPSMWDRIRIVTFNYDRSLKFFLSRAIQGTFNASPSMASDEVKKMQILHVYGKLGELDHEPVDVNPGRIYAPDVTPAAIQIAARSLRVIPEARNDDQAFERVREWVRWAESVCFLGFGFDTLNCRRMDIPSVLKERSQRSLRIPEFFATTMGLESAEERLAIKKVMAPYDTGYHTEQADCKTALRRWNIWE